MAEVYNAKKAWTQVYQGNQHVVAYPPEYVIRIFKGEYPRLNLKSTLFKDKKIADVGCGDGRNLIFLKECGLGVYGVEIASDIVRQIKHNLETDMAGISVLEGVNDSLPFADNFLDYLLSWNACYYMGSSRNFEKYVEEFSRVLQPGGYLILSIPKKTCFIYHNSEEIQPGYAMIKNDPFGIRNGEILRMFSGEDEIEQVFSPYFKNFVFGSIQDDCFGYDYHWHLVVCQKK